MLVWKINTFKELRWLDHRLTFKSGVRSAHESLLIADSCFFRMWLLRVASFLLAIRLLLFAACDMQFTCSYCLSLATVSCPEISSGQRQFQKQPPKIR